MVAGLLVKSLTRISPEAECLREDLGELGFHLYHQSIKIIILNSNSSELLAQLGNIFQDSPSRAILDFSKFAQLILGNVGSAARAIRNTNSTNNAQPGSTILDVSF